jgi:hypothetical protein
MLPLASPLHLMSGFAITVRASTTKLLLLELQVYFAISVPLPRQGVSYTIFPFASPEHLISGVGTNRSTTSRLLELHVYIV